MRSTFFVLVTFVMMFSVAGFSQEEGSTDSAAEEALILEMNTTKPLKMDYQKPKVEIIHQETFQIKELEITAPLVEQRKKSAAAYAAAVAALAEAEKEGIDKNLKEQEPGLCENFKQDIRSCAVCETMTPTERIAGCSDEESQSEESGLASILKISDKINRCYKGAFSILLRASRVDQCSGEELGLEKDSDKLKQVYERLCETKCHTQDVRTEQTKGAVKALREDAVRTLKRLYLNHLVTSLEMLEFVPREGEDLFSALPEKCVNPENISDELKKQIQRISTVVKGKIRSKIMMRGYGGNVKREEKCFSPGTFAHFYQSGMGEFKYSNDGNEEKKGSELNFNELQNIDGSLNDFVNQCVDKTCSSKKSKELAEFAKAQIAITKDKIGKACQNFQAELAKVQAADGIEGIASLLNPELLSLRKDIPMFTTDGKKTFGVIENCLNLYQADEISAADDIKCQAIRQLSCQPAIQDKIIKNKSNPDSLASIDHYNGLLGHQKLLDQSEKIENVICNAIKDNWNPETDPDLYKFTAATINGNDKDNIQAEIVEALLKDENLKLGEEDRLKLIQDFSEYYTLGKATYLERMKKIQRLELSCSQLTRGGEDAKAARADFGPLDLNKKCIELKKLKKNNSFALMESVQIETVKTTAMLTSKGYTGLDSSFGKSSSVNLKSEERRKEKEARQARKTAKKAAKNSKKIERSIASVESEDEKVESQELSAAPKLTPVQVADVNISNLKKSIKEDETERVNLEKSITALGLTPPSEGYDGNAIQSDIEKLEIEKQALSKEISRNEMDLSDLRKDREKIIAEEKAAEKARIEREVREASEKIANARASYQRTPNSIAAISNDSATKLMSKREKHFAKEGGMYNEMSSTFSNPRMKPSFEMIMPVSREQYNKVSDGTKGITVSLKTFNPQTFQYRSLDDIKKEYGTKSIYMDSSGDYFVKVVDKNNDNDEVIYQLRTEKREDGSILVNGVIVPVAKRKQLVRAVKRIPASTVLKVMKKENVEEKEKAGIVKKSKVKLYSQLLMLLKK